MSPNFVSFCLFVLGRINKLLFKHVKKFKVEGKPLKNDT